jgi:hypothetical protein
MPNFPSIYLELQEIWKRLRKALGDVSSLDTRVTSIEDKLKDYEYSPLNVTFISSDGNLPSVEAVVAGGVPPYRYNWNVQQGTYNTRTIISPTNSSSIVMINNLNNNSFMLSDSTLLKLDIDDNADNQNTFYHNHNVVGYTPMTLNIGRTVTASYCSEGNMITSSVPYLGLEFLDTEFLNDVYEPLSKCSDFITNRDQDSKFRALRDAYTLNVFEKITELDSKNHFLVTHLTGVDFKTVDVSAYPPTILETTETVTVAEYNTRINQQMSSSIDIAQTTVGNSQKSFRKINLLNGVEPQHWEHSWNADFLDLSKDWSVSGSISYPDLIGSISQHFAGYTNVAIRNLDPVSDTSSLPATGLAGQLIEVTGDTTYAWSTLNNNWNSYLAGHINDLTLRSINDHIGDVSIRYLDEQVSLPGSGTAGDLIVITDDTTYAWSDIESTWNAVLATRIEDIDLTRRSRRDAYFTSVRELLLATNPIIYTTLHLPLHKIR